MSSPCTQSARKHAAVPGLDEREQAVGDEPDGDGAEEPATRGLLRERRQRTGRPSCLPGLSLDCRPDNGPTYDSERYAAGGVPKCT